MPYEYRYHCKHCRSSYSVTVRTLFHKSRVDLQKWFFAMNQSNASVRQLANEIGVTKDTASFMIYRIKKAYRENPELINKLKRYEPVNKSNS